MLTFILILGLVWLLVALVFVVALAAAARAQVPVEVMEPVEITQRTSETVRDQFSADSDDMLESPVPT